MKTEALASQNFDAGTVLAPVVLALFVGLPFFTLYMSARRRAKASRQLEAWDSLEQPFQAVRSRTPIGPQTRRMF